MSFDSWMREKKKFFIIVSCIIVLLFINNQIGEHVEGINIKILSTILLVVCIFIALKYLDLEEAKETGEVTVVYKDDEENDSEEKEKDEFYWLEKTKKKGVKK